MDRHENGVNGRQGGLPKGFGGFMYHQTCTMTLVFGVGCGEVWPTMAHILTRSRRDTAEMVINDYRAVAARGAYAVCQDPWGVEFCGGSDECYATDKK